MLTEAEADELRASCTRFLAGHGPTLAAEALAAIPPETVVDRYGDGGVVAELEATVAGVLGTEAAVFLPSGVMAQQIVLRVHAERRGRRTVLYHPMCHLEQHEGRALERLQGLIGRPVGEAHRLLTAEDLGPVAEPAAALLIELPQRDLGGQQPSWEDLEAQVAWAREHGAAAHLDGARLWESAAGYGVPPARIAALFDSVYVSFYKGIGALAGCCVAGDAALVAEVREWRRRMGGTLFGLWPLAASALALLPNRLERMPRYLEQARAIAAALAYVPGVRVVPDPPQTPMLHVLLETDAATVDAAVRRLAAAGVWTIRGASATPDPAVLRFELPVGDATCALEPGEAAALIGALVQPA
ncbi:low specificity L-threonine aldolase [Amnibacterium sp.]|uniref:threonine aldolase family protein n=1 Tax=Amnibacterium sp. TaxID=1872496 RepID=UPI0026044C05|nr:beta-eliminating lyase-related protein [Amnibacterium sp.]MCU1474374.1 putative aromatic amino acid beta-eliminating lyase/threonine aldolase [Amnibacterium sp.]